MHDIFGPLALHVALLESSRGPIILYTVELQKIDSLRYKVLD